MDQLSLGASVDEIHDWCKTQRQRPEIHQADINDALMTLGAARLIYNRHPELRAAVEEHAPPCVALTATQLGLFMGNAYLCERVGLETETGRAYMQELFGQPFPELED